MDDAIRLAELKAFLRTRREALSPDAAGLSPGRRRRTPGLRREEVASAAGVGATWYTWLEQGRPVRPSRDALQRIARALRLTSSDESYLLVLGGAGTDGAAEPSYAVEPCVQTVIDSMVAIPALLFGPALEVLAFNRLADEIFEFGARNERFAGNHGWRMFMDPRRRALYADGWEELAHRTVGVLRARHARRLGDPEFEALLSELRAGSRDFVRMWNARQTATLDTMEVCLHHHKLGRLRVHFVRFLLPSHPDCAMSTAPPADAATRAVFARMARRKRPSTKR